MEQVDELGFIDRNESLVLKNNSIAGLVTFYPEQNHINAQPNKIFEYMASAVPVYRKVYFAGDWFSYWPGWQVGALDSAHFATDQIVEASLKIK